MSRLSRLIAPLMLGVAAGPAFADAPRVMTDIAPVHSLVARVMDGVGSPDLLLPPGASPHDFALRPSDAARLAQADIVVWVGHGLTPWLEGPLDTLATQAQSLELLDTDGWDKLALREDPAFDTHDDDHAADDGDHAAHDDADGDDPETADAAAHDHDHDHDHGDFDPHAWLDPAIAAVWLDHIATALAAADPDNAETYRANAAAARAEYTALRAATAARLAPLAGRRFIVPHDGYQYFEVAFGLPASGAIALSDAATPGPARIAALRDLIATQDIVCVLSDPQTSEGWATTLREGTTVRTALADPVGGALAAGPGLYPALITSMADAFVDCLQ